MKDIDFIYNAIIPLFSAFLGGYISIWVFKMGIKKQQKIEKRKQKEDNYETEEFLKLNIKSVLKFIDFQIDEISNVSKKIKDWNAKNLQLPIMPELKLNEIRELDFKFLFQILVLNRKGKLKEKSSDFINIKNCFHNIDSFVTNQELKNEEIHTRLNKEIELLNESQKNLLQLNNKYVSQVSKEKDDLLLLLQKYVVKKQREIINNGDGENIDIIFTQVINPIIVEIPNLKDKKDSRIVEVLENLMLIRKSYESLNHILYQRRKSLILSGRKLIAIKILLNKSVNNIENRKIKKGR